MQYKDYYAVLGLEHDATQDEVKRAYRKLARKYHPDVSQEADAEEHFKEVAEAYEVLKDPEKRSAYDQLGKHWQGGEEFRPPPDWDTHFEFSGGGFTQGDAAAFSDFFESLFGRGFHRGAGDRVQRAAGMDHRAKVLIDIEDSYRGATRDITLQRPTVDQDGHVRTREHRLRVRIPKGVCAGQHIRLSGQGESGLGGGPAGDLYLEVGFRRHPLFHVVDRNVHMELPVAPWEAALGATVRVPTPDGRVELKIPPGSSGGKQLRLKGRGLPAKTPGDLLIRLRIALPPADTPQARALYEKMRQESGFDPRQAMGA
jgi:curved DNA-binding protein